MNLVSLDEDNLAKVYAKAILENFYKHDSKSVKAKLTYTCLNSKVKSYGVQPVKLGASDNDGRRIIGRILNKIQELCYINGAPLITCLVVSKNKAIPKDGFFKSMLSRNYSNNLYINYLNSIGLPYNNGNDVV